MYFVANILLLLVYNQPMKKKIQKDVTPKLLSDVGLNMHVNVNKLRELPLPVVDIDIKELIWHFDMPVWGKDGTDDWNLTPWDIINENDQSLTHLERVANADLKYPILITDYSKKLVILDGVHRLVNAYMKGNKRIKAKIVPRSYLEMEEYKT
jgi:hypothetical protein